MKCEPKVLVVDQSEDSRAVLRTALEKRGVSILEASRTAEGLTLARQHQPDLVVLDLDQDKESSDEICGKFAQESSDTSPTLIVLGTARRQVRGEHEFVTKPYHYSNLVDRIEKLLAGVKNP
ncbi:MAG: response regulator [Planctomycetales bacterium]